VPANPPNTAMVELVRFGDADEMVADVVAANLYAIMGLATAIRIGGPEPQEAFIPGRHQFDAIRIINILSKNADGPPLRIGMLTKDLCTPILTYVFGESQLGGTTAVFSLYRLVHKSAHVTFQRAVKVALHETGHLLGINHCRAKGCLMAYSNSIEIVDQLPIRFCSACDFEIKRHLRNLEP
jgi:archaemetzincin